MNNKTNHCSRITRLLGLATITTLCIGLTSVSAKPPHGGGSGGGSGGGLPHPTASTVSQLIADINYANQAGGTFTVNLQPNTTFDLLTYNNSNGHGVNGFPVIGGTKTVNLTIVGNGDVIERVISPNSYEFRFFEVAPGSSLTLTQMTLQNGYTYAHNGGAIYNQGTLTISNCTLSANTAHYSGYDSSLLGGQGGALYNGSGAVLISNCLFSGNLATGAFAYGGAIYNQSGMITISNSAVSGNDASTGVSSDFAQLAEGGGIFNNGTIKVENSSSIDGNMPGDVQNDGALYLDVTSSIGILDGNSAISL